MFAYRSHNPAPQQNPCTSWPGLIEGYLAELAAAGRPPSTRRLRADQLRHLARGLGLAPHQVTRNTLLGWFAAQRWATETRRGYRGAARGFFGWAHRTGALAVDPAAELPAIRARQGVPRPVPDTAYQAALEHAPPRVALMLRLAAEAGLRRAEIAAIHTSDLTHNTDGY
jgi:integrase